MMKVATPALMAAIALPPTAQAVPAAFQRCEWVTADEALAILGGPVSTTPHGDQPGSVDLSCGYSRGLGEDGMESELRLPGAFPVDAATESAIGRYAISCDQLEQFAQTAITRIDA